MSEMCVKMAESHKKLNYSKKKGKKETKKGTKYAKKFLFLGNFYILDNPSKYTETIKEKDGDKK